ncbi:LLM class flavin-dependent oxidoreductase [Nonomuraea fastidiosa]|uniref:LLM class flavin-dependent oxidoreductase n=1 Tax=Nonomuraea fastidiosa TaxID=46173 RepID=UPI003671C4DD
MPDYGHELRSGSFVTPIADRPQAHDIPIWLGAFKPRLQRVVGRKGDGWLPSLPRLEPGGLARGNRVIGEAATRAGRDPRAITRLLNVTPADKAEDLARLAVEDGVRVFIVASDDPDELRRFAREIAPEIRERVAEARAEDGGGRAATFGGAYLSFETDTGPQALARAFPPGHLRRLRELKRRWDPTGLFRDNFPIDPAGS